jgi:hypothetical protein
MHPPRTGLLIALTASVALVACGSGGDSKPMVTTGPSQLDAGLPAREATLSAHLHLEASGTEAHAMFPDLTVVYTDDGHGNSRFPAPILPFRYWYSAEGNFTVSICAQNFTVFICPGRQDSLLLPGDWPRCQVSDFYSRLDVPVPAGP